MHVHSTSIRDIEVIANTFQYINYKSKWHKHCFKRLLGMCFLLRLEGEEPQQ
jgi:regulatory protein YycH of two-component signal transduction system YycFG